MTLWHAAEGPQTRAVPAEQAPLAPFGPQPMHERSVVITVAPVHWSVQEAGRVRQPPNVASHTATQHWLVGATAHVVVVGEQAHPSQVPLALQVPEQDEG